MRSHMNLPRRNGGVKGSSSARPARPPVDKPVRMPSSVRNSQPPAGKAAAPKQHDKQLPADVLAYSTSAALDKFLKQNRRKLGLSDDECVLLHLRRRRLSLERHSKSTQPALAAPATRLNGEDGKRPTPIKISIIGDVQGMAAEIAPSAVQIEVPELSRTECGTTARLPHVLCDLEATSVVAPPSSPWLAYAPPRVSRAKLQLWVHDEHTFSKPLRSACFQGTEAFCIVVDSARSATSAAAFVSSRLAEIRAWQAVSGSAEDVRRARPRTLQRTRVRDPSLF